MATDNDTPFDAALAALDVEVNINAHRQVTTYDILGLDAVRAAHRAEVERAVREAVEQEREACAGVDFGPIFDALQDHIIAMRDGRMSVLPAPNGLVVCEPDGKPSDIVRMTTRQAVQFIAGKVAAAIRARGVAKPRTDGEAPAAADEGAKS